MLNTAISLSPQHGYAGYNRETVKEWQELKTTLESRLENGQPIYVTISDDRRRGSIGKLTAVEVSIEQTRGSYYSSSSNTERFSVYVSGLTVEWDGRKNKVHPADYQVAWLVDRPDHAGTVWAWDPSATAKEKVEPVTVYDRLGEPVEPGQFVSFVFTRYGAVSLEFGTITRITDKGTVFVKTLKLSDRDRVQEVRCNRDNVVIVNDKLLQRLTYAKMRAI